MTPIFQSTQWLYLFMRNLITALSILIIGFFIAYLIGTMKPNPEKTPPTEAPAIHVSAVKAKPETLNISVLGHGFVEATQSIDIVSEVSGRVIKVDKNFVSGGAIDKKTILVRIDDTLYRSEYAGVKADIAAAEENLSTEKARATQAKKEWRDLGSEEANALFLRKPQLKSAQARLDSTKARLVLAKQKLNRTKLTLPFDANIIDTYIHEGQYLSPGNKIASVYHRDKRQVNIQLSQQQLQTANIQWPIRLNSAPNVKIFDPKTPNLTIKGSLLSRGATVDSKNQLIDLLVKLDSENAEYFLPGLYVEASVSGEAQDHILTLPEDAFHDKRYLLVVDDNSTVQFIPATFLSRQQQLIQVRADIKAGTPIITSRLPLATPGLKVTPIFEDINHASTTNRQTAP